MITSAKHNPKLEAHSTYPIFIRRDSVTSKL